MIAGGVTAQSLYVWAQVTGAADMLVQPNPVEIWRISGSHCPAGM